MSLGARAPHGGKTPRRADPHRAAATEGRRGPSHEMMSAVVSVGAVVSVHTVSDAGEIAELRDDSSERSSKVSKNNRAPSLSVHATTKAIVGRDQDMESSYY